MVTSNTQRAKVHYWELIESRTMQRNSSFSSGWVVLRSSFSRHFCRPAFHRRYTAPMLSRKARSHSWLRTSRPFSSHTKPVDRSDGWDCTSCWGARAGTTSSVQLRKLGSADDALLSTEPVKSDGGEGIMDSEPDRRPKSIGHGERHRGWSSDAMALMAAMMASGDGTPRWVHESERMESA